MDSNDLFHTILEEDDLTAKMDLSTMWLCAAPMWLKFYKKPLTPILVGTFMFMNN